MSRDSWKAAYAAARKALRKTGRLQGANDALAALAAREAGDHLDKIERGIPRILRQLRSARSRKRLTPAQG